MRRGLGAVLAVAMLGVLVTATTGGAALKTKSASTTIAADQKGTATAKCKRGTEAVSGGFNSPGFDGDLDDAAIWTYASKRIGDRKVTALGTQDGNLSSDLVAYAYCDKREPGLRTKSASTPVDFLEDQSVTVKCPRGTEAIWGGFDNPDVPSDEFPMLPLGSHREGKRKWTASGVLFNPNDPLTLTVFAYCDKDEPGLKPKQGSTSVDTDEVGTATAKCRKGREAISGGFFAPGGFDLDVGSEIYLYESHRKGKRKWTASGLNQGDPATLTVFAYCEKK
jgi:hypothetical protein